MRFVVDCDFFYDLSLQQEVGTKDYAEVLETSTLSLSEAPSSCEGAMRQYFPSWKS